MSLVSFSQCHHPRHPWRLLYLFDSRIAGQGRPEDLPRCFLLSSQEGDGWIGMVVTTSPSRSGQQNMQQWNFYDRHLFFRERPLPPPWIKTLTLFHLHLARKGALISDVWLRVTIYPQTVLLHATCQSEFGLEAESQ